MTISPIGARKNVITVGCNEGGYFGERKDLCESYSSRGPCPEDMKKPDIVAPGTDIISCNAFVERTGWRYRNAYISKSGTSMATPVVSGALALLLQKYPFYSNEQAKKRLLATALDLHEPWNKQGAGMIQINSLLT
jgi:serine protease AprX